MRDIRSSTLLWSLLRVAFAFAMAYLLYAVAYGIWAYRIRPDEGYLHQAVTALVLLFVLPLLMLAASKWRRSKQ
jgi:membrane protein YdbS with pleckstrin-like domain